MREVLVLSLAAFIYLIGCDKRNPVEPASMPPSFSCNATIETNVDAYVNHYVGENQPGVAVMVIEDDSILMGTIHILGCGLSRCDVNLRGGLSDQIALLLSLRIFLAEITITKSCHDR